MRIDPDVMMGVDWTYLQVCPLFGKHVTVVDIEFADQDERFGKADMLHRGSCQED